MGDTVPVTLYSNISPKHSDRRVDDSDQELPGQETGLSKPKSRRKRALTGVIGGFRGYWKLLGYWLLEVTLTPCVGVPRA